MSDFSSLIASVQSYIRQNGNNEITGNILQEVLVGIINTLGTTAINALETGLSNEQTTRANADTALSGRIDTAEGNISSLSGIVTTLQSRLDEGFIYKGIATPTTNPSTPTGKVFYVAVQAGTYTNFGNLEVSQGITILKYNRATWSADVVTLTDDIPIDGSTVPIQSDGAELGDYTQAMAGDFALIRNHFISFDAVPPTSVSYVASPTGSVLVAKIPDGVQSVRVDGAFADGRHNRYAFFSTENRDDWDTEHYLGYSIYDAGKYVVIPNGAKVVTLGLVNANHDEMFSGLSVVFGRNNYYNEATPNLDENDIPFTDSDGHIIFADGTDHTLATMTVRSYDVTSISQPIVLDVVRRKTEDSFTVFYYDGDGVYMYSEPLKSLLNTKDIFVVSLPLTLPSGCATVKVNVNTNIKDSVRLRKAHDVNIPPQLRMNKKERYARNSILLLDDIRYVLGEYIDTSGSVTTNSTAMRTTPIDVRKGDVITTTTLATSVAFAAWVNADGTYTPVEGMYPVNNTSIYYVPSDGMMVFSGRFDLTVKHLRNSAEILMMQKERIAPTTVTPLKYIVVGTGAIDDAPSGNWEVETYTDIDPNGLYLWSGNYTATNTVCVLNYYDENDVFLGWQLRGGTSTFPIKWENVYLDMPVGTVTVKINHRVDNASVLMRCINTETQDQLPSYYDAYLHERVWRIMDVFQHSAARMTSFAWATDIHYPCNPNMGKVAADILSRTRVPAFCCGGDILNKASNFGEDVTVDEALKMSFGLYYRDLDFIRRTGRKVLSVRGNHDFSINVNGSQDTESEAIYLPSTVVRNIIMSDINAVTNDADDKACYYYIDHPAEHVRYIYLDTTDSDTGSTNSMRAQITAVQFEWIVSQAIMTTPSDYNIVMVSHQYLQRYLGTNYSYSAYTRFGDMRKVLAAVQAKESVTVGGMTYDFTSFSPNILCHISGHVHRDNAVYMSGFWSFTTGGNYKSAELPQSPLYQKWPFRTYYPYNGEGTIYENLVDVVCVSTEEVNDIRVGAGFDRIFRQQAESVSVGNTVTITSTLDADDVEWWCYDSNDASNEDATSGAITLTNAYATIDSDGVLTGIAAGYVTVVAYSKTLKRCEFIGAKVNA